MKLTISLALFLASSANAFLAPNNSFVRSNTQYDLINKNDNANIKSLQMVASQEVEVNKRKKTKEVSYKMYFFVIIIISRLNGRMNCTMQYLTFVVLIVIDSNALHISIYTIILIFSSFEHLTFENTHFFHKLSFFTHTQKRNVSN